MNIGQTVFIAVIKGMTGKAGEVVDVFAMETLAMEFVETWVSEPCEWRGAEYVTNTANRRGRVRGYVARRTLR